jgi:hypothetical protein
VLIDFSSVCSYMFYMTCLKLTVQLKSVVEKNVVIKVVDVFQFIYGDV